MMPQENLEPFFRWYAQEPQQMEAIQMLQQAMPDSLLKPSSAWIERYRSKPVDPPKAEGNNPLDVPYDCQLDNPSGDGWRECFSSSCAMTAMFWGVIEHQNEYHAVRPRFGDSTEATAQIRTLQHFGLNARFVQVGSVEKLKAQIDRGRPAPVGFLHHGSVTAPSGGGHYLCAIGYYDDADGGGLIANDPYGECDVVNGGYPKTGGIHGKGVLYSWRNWAPRWSVSNDHDGWGLDVWK